MGIITVSTTLELRIYCKQGQQVSVNTLHWKPSAVSGPTITEADFLAVIEPIYAPLWKGIINNNATYEGMTMQIITAPISLASKNNLSTGFGTGGATSAATQTAGLIQWGTGLGGRKYRGRLFLPFPSTAEDGTTGFPNTGYMVGLAAIKDEYVGHTAWTIGGGAQTILPVLRHRKDKTGVTSDPTVIFSGTPVQAWATQKKRGYFGRPNASPF
jgi:hypothetical protein